jgi:hypothetical protein
MRKVLCLAAASCWGLLGFSQEKNPAQISGTVLQSIEKNLPLPGATIQVFRATDTVLLKLGISNKEGQFDLTTLPTSEVLVKVSAVGYSEWWSQKTALKAGNNAIPTIQLQPAVKTMEGVTVVAKKPMVEQRIDKTVVNVEAAISNAGSSALEVLEKSPGVSVDRDGNIGLKGKQGVLVMIDNKPTYLSAQDLANLLRNMPANQLDQIEIMTQPSAKYDAAGNSGIINIKTKKNKQKGFNGSFTGSVIQGVYPKASGSVQANYRTGKVNLFGNFSSSYWEGFSEMNLDRNFRINNNITTAFDQVSVVHFTSRPQNFRGGMDYYVNKKTTIGFNLNGNIDLRKSNVNSHTDITNGNEQTKNAAQTSNRDQWKNGGINLNLRRVLNDKGREFTADLDYLVYNNSSAQLSTNTLTDRNGVVVPTANNELPNPYILRGQIPSAINIYSAKADYVHPLKKDTKFEAGWKSSYVTTDNNAPYEFLSNGVWLPDARSNHFIYKENINAVYANLSKQVKKWGIQTGLRLENTTAKGHQVVKNEKFTRDYTSLFPTLYISYAASDKSQFGLSAGRRLERPNYQDMNPFQQILDRFTYQEGNPYLRPQYSQNYELSYNYKGSLNFNLNYTRTTDIINDIIRQNDAEKTTFQTKENIANSKNLGLAVSYNKQLLKWWTVSAFANGFYNQFSGLVNNAPLEVDMFSVLVNLNNNFSFGKGWGAELSGFYRGNALEGGLIVSRPMGVINAGVSKQILNKKGSLKLALRDPFWIQQFRGYTRFENIDLNINSRWDNRRVGLTFSYRFGKGQQAAPRRKTGGASDEQNRVGNNSQQ